MYICIYEFLFQSYTDVYYSMTRSTLKLLSRDKTSYEWQGMPNNTSIT